MADIASITTDQNATVLRGFGGFAAFPVGYDAFDPIRSEGEQFVFFANGDASRFRDEEVKPYLLAQFGPRMFRAGRTVQGAAFDHQRAHLEREADYRKPAASIDRSHDTERRARFRGLAAGALMGAITDADLADLTALVADGNLAALPDDAFREAEQHFLTLNMIERTGMQARFAAKATLSDPLPVTADVEAARRQADTELKRHKDNADVIAVHRRGLQDYAAFLGQVFDLTAEEAFNRMIEA